MKRSISLTNLVALGVVSMLVAGAAALVFCAPAGAAPKSHAPKPVSLLQNVAYYTVNNGSTFCRYTTPQSSVPLVGGGTASQARNHHGGGALTLSINDATGYADDGFYEPVGTLGDLASYVIKAKAPFESNLWFDTNTGNDNASNGDFFSWSGGCLSSDDGDTYGLGPTSTTSGSRQVELVTGSSTFALTCNSVYGSITLTQLKSGYCSGINAATPVALWVGIDVGSGGSLSTKIVRGQIVASK
jgi:hypothetical protein